MKKIFSCASILILVLTFGMAYAQSEQAAADTPDQASSSEGAYCANLKAAYLRGVKNIVSAPLEVPMGIRDAQNKEKKCPMGSTYVVGALKGAGQGLLRLGSGLWDLVAGWLPGHQQGMPVTPETLF
jgi:hypothetical protein